ncbi:dihydroorotase [Candidatus Saccharibacteria bacterium]|nr:dihydroorotase [Candidatus Saccharibacteria bacterium]
MRLLVKNGEVVNPSGDVGGKMDVLIEDDHILAIESGISENYVDVDQVVDAASCIVAPGLVDVHVHFRDPGQTRKENIFTGAAAAKKGGYTSVVMMANTVPPIDNVKTLEYVLEKGRKTGIKVYAVANVTEKMEGQKLTDMEALVKAGAVGFSDDGKPILDEQLVKMAMKEAARLGVPISFHEEDPKYISVAGFNNGVASRHFGVVGADRLAEISMIERDINLALATGAKVDIQHISSKEGVDLVMNGKIHGGEIYAEATPHHFSLTEKDAMFYGTLAKMNPPLRTEADREAIIEGLRSGAIDMIVTDHAPHTREEKNSGIANAPSGIIGLETALGLGITNLVREGRLTMWQLIERMSVFPARVYGLQAGILFPGGAADVVVFNPDEKWTVTDKFASKAKNSPFIGFELYGKVKYTICDGEVVYRDE